MNKIRKATDEETLILLMDDVVQDVLNEYHNNGFTFHLVYSEHGYDYAIGKAAVYIEFYRLETAYNFVFVCRNFYGNGFSIGKGVLRDLLDGVVSVPILSPGKTSIKEWI